MVFSWFRGKRAQSTPVNAESREEPDVESGCNGVCELDMAAGLCKGCLRTPDEIGNWRHYSAAQKHAVNAAAEARRAAE